MNFKMFKLVLEKAEEPEIKLPTFIGSWRKLGNSWVLRPLEEMIRAMGNSGSHMLIVKNFEWEN